MSLNSSKYLYFYFIFIILTVFVIFGVGLQKYISLNPEKLFLEFESSIEMENLSRSNVVKDIRELGRKDSAKESLALLEGLKEKTSKINKFINIDEYEDYQRKRKDVKESLLQLISSPELSSIFLVFNNKVTQLKNYVTQKRMQRLRKILKRMNIKTHPSRINDPNFFDVRKNNRIFLALQRDIDRIKNITTSFKLNPSDKNHIISSISTWSTELKMLKEHLSYLNDFEKKSQQLQLSYNTWYSAISPTIIIRKLNLGKRFESFIVLLGFLLIFLLCGFIGSYFLYKKIDFDTKKNHEEKTIEIINNHIIPFNAKMPSDISNNFGIKLKKLKEYFHKRMSYGIIFQEATPFSALLLDSNLQLIWANDLFYQTWNLKKKVMSNEALSWDYLQQFTNLGEDDPIQLALKESVAGIYNIQIRPQSSKEALSYEIYITPVQYLGQKRIMLFLYPLRPLEESLHHQMKSLLGPIARSLNALIDNKYTAKFSRDIEKDFNIVGIGDIFEKFKSYYDLVLREKESLMNEIYRLETLMADSGKALDDIKELTIMEAINNKEALSLFASFRKTIMDSMEERVKAFNTYEKEFYKSKNLLKDQKGLLKNFTKINTALRENSQSFLSLLKFREDFKNSEHKINNFKYNFLQMVEMELFCKKNKRGPVVLDKNIQRIKSEAKKLDDLLNSLLTATKSFDISISKMEMILKEHKAIEISHIENLLKEVQISLESEVSTIHHINEKSADIEHKMADDIRDLYDRCCITKARLKHIEEWADSQRIHAPQVHKQDSFLTLASHPTN